jgi:hypothetical protein
MVDDPLRASLPPSGAWSGYYSYRFAAGKHRMKLDLLFSGNGGIQGDGLDDIGSFLIQGVFNPTTLETSWTKAYIGRHTVDYRGLYNNKSISGVWTLGPGEGDFRIWPGASAEGEEETAQVEIEEPEAVLV